MSNPLSEDFLQAAASLAVLYIVVAWVSSKTVELAQTLANLHGKMLRRELSRCFGDEKEQRFTHYFYWHPLIRPLTQPSLLVDIWRRIRRRFAFIGGDGGSDYPPGRLPGYIAPESFAAVVMNPFPWPTTREPLIRLLNANLTKPEPIPSPALLALVDRLLDYERPEPSSRAEPPKPHNLPDVGYHRLDWKTLLKEVPYDESLVFEELFLAGQVDLNDPDDPSDPARKMADMCRRNKLITHPFETRINAVLRDREWDIDEFRAGLRFWYAEAMSRVTGRFSRAALIGVFLVALMICLIFQINALTLFSELLTHPSGIGLPEWHGIRLLSPASADDRWALLGAAVSAALAALGAPFWYDLLGKLSRRSAPTRSSGGA
jgi:hypothetical protein